MQRWWTCWRGLIIMLLLVVFILCIWTVLTRTMEKINELLDDPSTHQAGQLPSAVSKNEFLQCLILQRSLISDVPPYRCVVEGWSYWVPINLRRRTQNWNVLDDHSKAITSHWPTPRPVQENRAKILWSIPAGWPKARSNSWKHTSILYWAQTCPIKYLLTSPLPMAKAVLSNCQLYNHVK